MSAPTLPPIIEVSSLPKEGQIAMLDVLFESSPALHAILLPLLSQPYASYTDFISVARPILLSVAEDPAKKDELFAIVAAHPRLGEKKEGGLSVSSVGEQASLAGGEGGEGGMEEELGKLNREYEDRFPGLRYVVFVDGRGREEILEDIRWRIERGYGGKEGVGAVNAMCDIAVDRAVKILRSARGEVV